MSYSDTNGLLKFVIPINICKDESYNKIRRCILLLLANLINDSLIPHFNYTERSNIITTIEMSCYKKALDKCNKLMIIKSWSNPRFENIYRIYTNNVTKNLDNKSEVKNNYLIDQIINKTINLENIAFLSNIELFPEKSIHIINKFNQRTQQNIKKKTTSMYTCRNCKEKCATMQEIQLRRIDEAANTKLCCVFCGNTWFM